MHFLSAWVLAGLVLVPVIFLWGWLAPRGRPVIVGSLMLWRRALAAGPVGKPSAKVRLKDPLLWLDALFLALLVLACARPAVQATAPGEPVATIVLDRTAGMKAEGGGKLEFVWYNLRDRAAGLFKALGDAPVRVVYVPDESGQVRSETVPASEWLARGPAPWEPVMVARDVWPVVMAESVARRDLPVIVLTDLPPAEKIPPGVFVIATGRDSRNVGLERVAVRQGADRWWLLVAARSARGATGAANLTVMGDDKVLTVVRDFLAPGAAVERVLTISGLPPRELYVGLVGYDDDFQDDNAAHFVLEPAGRIRVLLLGTPDPALRRALASREDTTVVEGAANTPAAGPAAGASTRVVAGPQGPASETDLVIACGVALPADWQGPAVVIAPPEAVGPVRPTDARAPAEWRVARSHPLAEALYLEPPRIGIVRQYAVAEGTPILLGTPDVPLIVTWQADGARRMAVLLGLDEPTTDWPRRPGFPVFWSHALDWLVPKDRRAAEFVTFRPFAPLPGTKSVAPGKVGFADVGGRRLGISFIGTDIGFRFGFARDDSAAAIEAVRGSIARGQRASWHELWPYLAAAALLVLLARVRVTR